MCDDTVITVNILHPRAYSPVQITTEPTACSHAVFRSITLSWPPSKEFYGDLCCKYIKSCYLLCFRRLRTSWRGRRSAGCALQRKWLICVFISPLMRSVQKILLIRLNGVPVLPAFNTVPIFDLKKKYKILCYILFMTCFIGQRFICDCVSSSYMTSLPVLKIITCRRQFEEIVKIIFSDIFGWIFNILNGFTLNSSQCFTFIYSQPIRAHLGAEMIMIGWLIVAKITTFLFITIVFSSACVIPWYIICTVIIIRLRGLFCHLNWFYFSLLLS